ncbi:MAG TPA: AI-2E family transporter [Pseudogracilibacillus sp.]|nr:AI-2E family transporter [Pseudogracilibacillus sp.]
MRESTRFIKFLGGRNLLFSLLVLILIGVMIFIYTKVSFIFYPVGVFLSTVAPPAILAFIAYYLLNPIVNLLEKLHIKRLWGIIIIILSIGGIITGLVFLVFPSVEKQINDLIIETPGYFQQLSGDLENLFANSFMESYYDDGVEWLSSAFSDLPNLIQEYMGGVFTGIKNIASTVTHVFVALFTFPFVLFFLLKGGETFKEFFIQLLPPKFRNDVEKILNNMDKQVGAYIQGQIIVAIVIGVLLYIGYLIIGLEYAIILAIIAALTSVVPYIGPMIAITPAIVIAIVDSPFMILKLAIVWAAVQFLEGNFVSPNVMGRTMQIHPLTIIFVLLIGGNLFGVFGVILGIPGYAILKVIFGFIYDKFKVRYDKYYAQDDGPYEIDNVVKK